MLEKPRRSLETAQTCEYIFLKCNDDCLCVASFVLYGSRLEKEILLARNDYKLKKASADRLSAVLLGLQQGSNGLLQRVGPYLHLADTGVFDLTKVEDEHFFQGTLEALSIVEQVTTKMLECVTGTGGEMQGSSGLKSLGGYDDEEDDSISQNYDSKSAASSLDVTIGANNIRVKVHEFIYL